MSGDVVYSVMQLSVRHGVVVRVVPSSSAWRSLDAACDHVAALASRETFDGLHASGVDSFAWHDVDDDSCDIDGTMLPPHVVRAAWLLLADDGHTASEHWRISVHVLADDSSVFAGKPIAHWQARLNELVVPNVQRMLREHDVTADSVAISFAELMPIVDGCSFDIAIVPRGELHAAHMSELAAFMLACGSSDESIAVDGVEWLIGDGDDASAAVLRDGVVHVWLQAWL
jgi:hypothetical protein